jgi:hypothetical protein
MRNINKIFAGITMSLLLACTIVNANPILSDTVVLKFRNNVNIVVITDGEKDLDSALSYDLNQIFEDLKYKVRLGEDESITLVVDEEFGERYLKDTVIVVETRIEDKDDDYDYEAREREREKRYRKRIRNYFIIDLGMNNYLEEDGGFPDESNALYTVRPWGSWYIGLATIFKANVAGPLYVEWGGGIDWYSFKFENHRTRITKTDLGLDFTEDLRPEINPLMSKLSVTYINARIIPVFDFSRRGRRDHDRLWNSNIGGGFRFGLGPYAAYRIDSWTKYRYREGGEKNKPKEKSNYYLNNFRYGARAQVGWKGIDLFVNYDLNQLFEVTFFLHSIYELPFL